jgi:hypothetical protein
MSGIPSWALIPLDWLSLCDRRWLSASRCDQSLVLEMPARWKATRPRAWMACRAIAVNTKESYRAAGNGQGVPGEPRSAVGSAPAGLARPRIDELTHHLIGVYVARCGHRLMMLTTLHESPPSRICRSCARWGPR